MLVSDMIVRIRSSTHDQLKTGYTDDELVGYINDGVRFLRRMIFQIYPLMLTEDLAGSLEEGEKDIVSEKKIIRVYDVRVNGRSLRQYNSLGIYDNGEKGTPTKFYRVGLNTISLYPIPNRKIDYLVKYICEQELLTEKDDTPFSTDFDDFVYEYALIRASVGNEFSLQQEQMIMSAISKQVESMLYSMSRAEVQVKGYWDSGRDDRDDYGRRW